MLSEIASILGSIEVSKATANMFTSICISIITIFLISSTLVEIY